MKAMRFLSKLKYSGLSVLALLLAGCASNGPQFNPAAPGADAALIYLYRPSSIVGAGNHYLAAVNGQVVARMKSGSYFVLSHPQGEVVISRKTGSALGWWGAGVVVGALEGFIETDRFQVVSGSRYFVQFPAGRLTVDEAEALREMRGVELLPPLTEK